MKLFAILLFACGVVCADVKVPYLSSPVTDLAQMIDSGSTSQLIQVLKRERDRGGPQIAILTIPSLEGDTIEQFSMRVAEEWKLGTAKKDDGILIVIAQQDRRLRIEVGQGLEGAITDVHSHRIITQMLVPSLRRGHLGDGLLQSVETLLRLSRGEAVPLRESGGITRRKGFVPAYLFLLFIGMMIVGAIQRRLQPGRRGHWGSAAAGYTVGSILSGRGRGGFGGGGFGGGGFGGGGGGFSGGGSSGSW